MDSTVSEWSKQAIEVVTNAGIKIIMAMLILVIGLILIKALLKLVDKSKTMNKSDPVVKSFLMNFIKYGLYVLLIISIIVVLGVPMASIVTVLAACGLAIGMALQGSLSNLAGGIMLMIFRPFTIGDYIKATEEEGIVQELGLFYTVIRTYDYRVITIPNGTLMAANVINYTKEKIRRVDLTFNLDGTDISGACAVILEQLNSEEKIIREPAEPVVVPTEVIPGGVAVTSRAWTTTDDYWDVYYDLLEKIPTALNKAGYGGPLPAYSIVTDK